VVKLIEITQDIVNKIIEDAKKDVKKEAKEVILEATGHVEPFSSLEQILTNFIVKYLSNYLKMSSPGYPRRDDILDPKEIIKEYEEELEKNDYSPLLAQKTAVILVRIIEELKSKKNNFGKKPKTTDAK